MNTKIKFNYMYRDASNFKAYGAVIFFGTNELGLTEINHQLVTSIGADRLFIASQIRIPEVFLYLNGDITVNDHCFHEFISIEYTKESENDCYGRTISQFICEIEAQSNVGWQTFDPAYTYQYKPRY